MLIPFMRVLLSDLTTSERPNLRTVVTYGLRVGLRGTNVQSVAVNKQLIPVNTSEKNSPPATHI